VFTLFLLGCSQLKVSQTALRSPSTRLLLGNAWGDNFGVTGRMMAFDADSGGRIWSFDLVPETGEASRTWPPSTEVIPKAGGATWTSYALDTLAGSLFLATGNAAPDFLDHARPGTNLYTYSVIELDSWRYPTGQLIGGGVVTYRAAGRQLVAVASGMHAPLTWKLESPPAKVVVFGLP
jgi:hypothetical protein